MDQIAEYLGSEAMQAPSVLPTSNLGMAAAYVRRHWHVLNRFTGDVSIPIDSNDCEQLMKRVATGRKNWLFKGSVGVGQRAANLMAIIGTAVRNNLDVHAYLKDVLRRAFAGETDWQSLAPHVWKATSHPDAACAYRQDERRKATDRKKVCRARRSPR